MIIRKTLGYVLVTGWAIFLAYLVAGMAGTLISEFFGRITAVLP